MSESKVFFYAFCGAACAISVSKWENLDEIALVVGMLVASATIVGLAWLVIRSWLEGRAADRAER